MLALAKLAVPVDPHQNVKIKILNGSARLVHFRPMVLGFEVPPLPKQIEEDQAIFVNVIKEIPQS
jgi:hypothetical protein